MRCRVYLRMVIETWDQPNFGDHERHIEDHLMMQFPDEDAARRWFAQTVAGAERDTQPVMKSEGHGTASPSGT